MNTKLRYELIIEELLKHCASPRAPPGFEITAGKIVLETKTLTKVHVDPVGLHLKVADSEL